MFKATDVNIASNLWGESVTFRNLNSFKLRLRQATVLTCLTVPLVACGEDENLAAKRAEYEVVTMADLQNLVETAQFEKALDILLFFREEGTATNGHLQLMAEIYMARNDGVAVEQLIYRLRDRGVSAESTALLLAQSFMLQADYDGATRALKDVELPEEDVFDALLLRGDIFTAQQNSDRAGEFYRAALELKPEDPYALSSMALHLIKDANVDQAAELFGAVTPDQIADDAILNYTAGMIARYQGAADAARPYFERAIALNSFDILSRIELTAILMAQNELDAAQDQIDAIYDAFPNNAMANFYTALLKVKEGKFDLAEDILLRTSGLVREYPLAAHVYGLTTYELGKYSEAIPPLEMALRYFPTDISVRLALADSLVRRGDGSAALTVLAPFTDIGRGAEAHFLAATAAATRGDMRLARQYSDKALELAQTDENITGERFVELMRRAAYTRYLDGDVEAAKVLLDKMYAENPDDTESLISKANLLISSGDYAAASAVVEQIFAIEPDSAEVSNLQGNIFHRQLQYDQAIAAYSTAIERVPQYQSALKNRALAYTHTQQFEEALKDLELLSRLAPNDMLVAALYGRALIETGAPDQALPYLEAAKEVLTNSQMVFGDYAEALAGVGQYSAAINAGRKAMALDIDNEGLADYMNNLIEDWQEARKQAANEAAEAEAIRRAAQQEELQAEAELKKQLQEQAAELNEGAEDERKLKEELKKLAQEINSEDTGAERAKELEALETELRKNALDEEDAPVDLIIVRRDTLFAAWLANELGYEGDEATRYLQSLQKAAEAEPGDTDIIRKALNNLEDAGKFMTVQAIEKKLAEFHEIAKTEATAEAQQ